ncbi:hypothetical protein [Natronobiforma cellulositropha]|uniref:hypothetical protein n=1 Tax=Natronobiforma cellulositropha TaxID=1679076 RepID=UPI0021D61571|nr:hypothetical protein [Natronobiforma cellulositropha]
MIRGRDVALPLLAVGTAVVAGYVLQSERARDVSARTRADIGARVVDASDIPTDATVVDVSSRRLRELPGVRRALERAVHVDARDEWANVTLERTGAWDVVDALRRSLPYYDADGTGYNGVYVRYGDRFVVLDAIGWARVEGPIQ